MFDEVVFETFDEREKKTLEFWQRQKIFEKSVEGREKAKTFTFYDGPPFATGLPHYGHILAGTIKDVVLRYKTMKGFYAPRRFGWDCHGLPVEHEVEKERHLSGATAIEHYGIPKFNEECRSIVLRYSTEWKERVARMGRWVDFSRTWHTMDLPFMESVWWVFKELWDKGLVYEGFKVMPFSAELGTPLSNFEAGENYKDVDDPSLTVAFPLVNEEASLLVWTTTPWTLISNLAVMVGPKITYVKIRDRGQNKVFILAKVALPRYYKSEAEYELIEELEGEKLAGLKYHPLFDYFKERGEKGAFRVILEESVGMEEGTGLVHSAPAFGDVDFYACKREGIELVCPVDNNGKFTREIPEYAGKFVKEADSSIMRRLKERGLLFHQSTIRHRYPFCWRSDTPLIYKAVSSWFVHVEKIKEKLLAANDEIRWCPDHLKYGRFGKWLEGARDWAISRNRYWGTPIPIWRAEDGTCLVVGSIKELEALTGTKITDLHRHFIDDLEIVHDGKTFKRIPEVFDCWFESGSMPYAQNHYPFEHRELFEKNFPADFIAEGLDQTRGWFYTLTILAAALFNRPAFKNVIVNGIVLAADGTKMSKRLKNYPDPMEMVKKYGADAIRLYMMHSPVVKAEDLRFSEQGLELVLRQILIPLWNAYGFFITYARIYGWKPSRTPPKPAAVIDRWILSCLNGLAAQVEEGMDAYDLSRGVEPFVGFIDQLTNWYIRRSRRRFWEDEATQDRMEAFETLYTTLVTLSKITAPFIPFISEAIWQNLKGEGMAESVHLADFPKVSDDLRDVRLEEAMRAVQTAVSLGHGLRKEHKLKVRQPLPAVHIASSNERLLEFLKEEQHLIAEELNVKEVDFVADEQEYVKLKAKPNFRVLGKKVGKKMPAVQAAIGVLSRRDLETLFNQKPLTLVVEGESIEILPEEVEVSREVREGTIAANEGEITLALDTTLSEALLIEGMAREIVNKINTMRREMGFDVTDRIVVKMETTARVQEALRQYETYIAGEVLAVRFEFGPAVGELIDLNGESAKIELVRVAK